MMAQTTKPVKLTRWLRANYGGPTVEWCFASGNRVLCIGIFARMFDIPEEAEHIWVETSTRERAESVQIDFRRYDDGEICWGFAGLKSYDSPGSMLYRAAQRWLKRRWPEKVKQGTFHLWLRVLYEERTA